MLRTGPTELGAIASHQAFTKLRNLSKLARASSLHGNHVRSHVSSSPDTARAQSRLYSLASPARRSQSRSEPDIVPGDIKATLEAHRRRYQETRISWKYTTGDDATSGTSGDWQTVKKVAGGNIRERREARFLPDRPPRDLAKLDPVEEGPPPGKPSPARPPPEKRVIAYRRSGSKQERRRGRAGFDTGPGRIISPDTGNKAQDLPFWPFAVPEQRTVPDMDREQQLSSDIAAVASWMQLKPGEDEVRQALARSVMSEISQAEGDIEWAMQGSQTTGLATSTSDVDLAFIVPSLKKKADTRGRDTRISSPKFKARIHDKLVRMSKYLGWHGFGDFVLVSSKFPLLRATHEASGVNFQIVMVESQPVQRERVKTYLEEYPHLRGVYCVLRAALAARKDLSEPLEGGIGSFPLLMLIVLAFKTANLSRADSAASALKAVLDFTAKWNTKEDAYVVDPVELFKKTEGRPVLKLKTKRAIELDASIHAKHIMAESDTARPWRPCFLEPDNLLNNLGKNAYRWRDIKETFKKLSGDIDRYLAGATIPGRQMHSSLGTFFGTSLAKYRDKRAQLEIWSSTKDGAEAMSMLRQQKLPDTVTRPPVVTLNAGC